MRWRGSQDTVGAPGRWAPVVGLVVLLGGYAALERGFKVAAVSLLTAGVTVVIMAGLARIPDAHGRARVLRWLPAVIPLLLAFLIDLQPHVVEVVLPDPNRRWRASVLLLAIGAASLILILLGVDVRSGIRRAVHRCTSALRTGVAFFLYLVVLLPLGVAHLWRRADPLRTGTTATGSAWHPVTIAPPSLATRSYRRERPARATGGGPAGRPSRIASATVRGLGLVVVILLVDVGLGSLWNAVAPKDPSDAPTQTVAGGINVEAATASATPTDLDAPDAEVYPPDPREELPSMVEYPWRHDYFQELQRAPTTYWPYLLWRPLPAEGRYVNIDELGARRTYRTAGAIGPGVPDVDFYGGSTTYGEGQRDLHTIPSEVARLAEADGLPIRAHNRGVRGWVNWQEMLLFEELSASTGTRPDLAVFSDGANEHAAQSSAIRGVPAHVDLDRIAVTMSGEQSIAAGSAPPEGAPEQDQAWDHVRALGRDYLDASAIARAGRWVKETATGSPASASSASALQVEPEEFNFDSEDVQPIYRRGQAIVQDIARRRGVDVVFFWQPLQGGGWQNYDDDVRPPAIDLSQALVDHDDVFIDITHHNEAGSLLVAEAMWQHLKPRVQSWYDEH